MDTGIKPFIVTVDTEPDGEWGRPGADGLSCDNARSLPRFQALCEAHGVLPVYLVDYVMAGDGFATEFLSDCASRGQCEIGAHMHPWSNPPFEVRVAEDDYKYHPFVTEYPIDAFRAKLDSLLERIQSRLGVLPTTFRAGRWVIGKKQIEVLHHRGFTIDCSVTPFRHWEKERNAPGSDYTKFGPDPFYWDEDRKVLEVPLSGWRFKPQSGGGNPYRLPIFKKSGLPKNVLDKLYGPRKLAVNGGDWLFRYKKFNAVAVGLKRYMEEVRPDFIQSMLHSSELHLGTCFDRRSDLNIYWEVLERSFASASVAGYRGMTLAKFRERNPADYEILKVEDD